MLIAALLGGGGSTGMQMLMPGARNDPFTGQEGKALAAHVDHINREATKDIAILHKRLTEMRKTTYTKEQEQDLHNGMWIAIKANDAEIKEIESDIRLIYSNIARLPPAPLLDRMTKAEAELKHIKEDHAKLLRQIRVYR